MATIKIAHASIDENGKIIGGKAGDQTGKEVCVRSYYMSSKGWYMFRFISVQYAEAMAEAMKQAAENKYIGYDQGERLDIMASLKKYGSMKKIAEPTECDCSSLIRACIYQATGKDVGNFTTDSEPTVLAKSGLFKKKVSVTASTEICDGDILVTKKKGHTVAAVSGNSRQKKKGCGYMFEPETVKKGSKGKSVGLMQTLLKGKGYKGKDGKALAIDNSCGTNTEYAINAYQTARRKAGVELGTDGKNDSSCGPKMWKDLIGL